MKRKYVILLILALAVIGGALSILFLLQNQKESNVPDVGIFDLTKYQWEIQTFSTDKNVGEINKKNVAINHAKLLWLEKYNIDIHEKKIEVDFDPKEECWHIQSTSSPNTLGGVLHAIIQKNGDVLAVWIDD